MSISVTKRDGTKTPYDVTKIKKSIELATNGIKVNPLELESKIDQFLKPGIKTKDIQKNIIGHAVQLATAQNPEWLMVAGKALAMDEHASFKLKGKSFAEIVDYNIKKGEYSKELSSFYTKEDLDILGKFVDHDRDYNYSYASLMTSKHKYIGKYELTQHMHMVNAMRFGQFEDQETRLEFVSSVYDILSLRKLSLATPFMLNLRKGGNIASCFILSIEDNIESIYDNIKRIALVSKNGGGLGIYLGNLRAKGSDVAGTANAAGSVVQWIKVINDTLVAVNQSFVSETKIVTSLGDLEISSIKSGDLVKTHDGSFKPVVDIREKYNTTPIVNITTELGSTLVTNGHPVYVVNFYDGDIHGDIISGKIKPYWVDAGLLTTDHIVISVK